MKVITTQDTCGQRLHEQSRFCLELTFISGREADSILVDLLDFIKIIYSGTNHSRARVQANLVGCMYEQIIQSSDTEDETRI